jgi:uncharacterized protein YbjT (DUF2867 family)
MKVLVTGVTGKTGRRVAESLVNRGVGVRALVRDIERGKMATLGMGVELVLGDFDDPQSIEIALKDCEAVFIVSIDNERQIEQEMSVAKLAKDVGLGHIVKLSSSDADDRPYRWSVAHAEIEAAISEIGVPYSFLRPHYFMQNYGSLLKVDSAGAVTLEAPANDGEIGAIDAYDIGECAAALLANGDALNDYALLTGSENISMERVAAAFSSAIDQEISYVNLDPKAYLTELEADDSGSAKDIADVYEEVRVGTMAVNSDNVERITGNKPRSIEQYAIENQDAIKSTIERVVTASN